MTFNVLRTLLLIYSLILPYVCHAQQAQKLHPGLAPHIPTRIDWLTTTLQASLRTEALDEDGYLLQITSPDSEAIMIYVRYLPTVNREAMNIAIDASREVIHITAKSYGWDKWLKIVEDIKLADQFKR
jgi:hypothetical protein